MPNYRFLGSLAELPNGQTLRHFGAVVALDDATASDLIVRDKVALLPEAEWAEIGISDADLKRFPAPAHWDLPEAKDFAAKRLAAMQAWHDYRNTLEEAAIG